MRLPPQDLLTLSPYECDILVPHHLGLIMDGNGRWATNQGQSRLYGHRVGLEHVRTMVPICFELGVSIVSGYLWSLENWRRPAGEVSHMLGLLRTFGRSFMRDLHHQGVRIVHSGNRDGLHEHDLAVIDEAVELTRHNGPHIFNIVFNYSGRDELVRAARSLAKQGFPPEALTEEVLAAQLFAPLPALDMVIRTAGEFRLSNFLLWQSANAVAHVIDLYWPDVTRADLEAAFRAYTFAQRSRSCRHSVD